jgi:hypothetical protein
MLNMSFGFFLLRTCAEGFRPDFLGLKVFFFVNGFSVFLKLVSKYLKNNDG